MSKLLRSLSTNLTTLASVSTSSLQSLSITLDERHRPVYGPDTIEETEFRASLRAILLDAWVRVLWTYYEVTTGGSAVAQQRCCERSCMQRGDRHCKHYFAENGGRANHRCRPLKRKSCSSIPPFTSTTMDHRTNHAKINNLRQAQMLAVLKPLAAQASDRNQTRSISPCSSPLLSVSSDRNSIRHPTGLARSSLRSAAITTYVRSLRAPTSKTITPIDDFLLPRDIVIALLRVNSTYLMMWQHVGTKYAKDENGDIKPYNVPDIADDDGVACYDNPFSSLYGKVKAIQLLYDDTMEPWSRHLHVRFVVHELIRTHLVRMLPEYRSTGRTAEDAAEGLMPKLLRAIEEIPVQAEDDEVKLLGKGDEVKIYAIAILQGFIDRCRREQW